MTIYSIDVRLQTVCYDFCIAVQPVTSREKAIKIVMERERCPRQALSILSVKEIHR